MSHTPNIFKRDEQKYEFRPAQNYTTPNFATDYTYGFDHIQSQQRTNMLRTLSFSQIKNVKIEILEDLNNGFVCQRHNKKRAFFKWLVMTRSKSSLVVLERVLTSAKPSIMKTLWMLRAEWMRRGSYAFKVGFEKLLLVFGRLQNRGCRRGFKNIEDRLRLQQKLRNLFSRMKVAQERKFASSLIKLIDFKRNWESIQKVQLLNTLKTKLMEKQRQALRLLFSQTRVFRPFKLVMTLHNITTRKQFAHKKTFFNKFRNGNIREEFKKRLFEGFAKAEFRNKQEIFSKVVANAYRRNKFKPLRMNHILSRVFNRHKKKSFHDLRHCISWKGQTLKRLENFANGHQVLEKKLAYDKTFIVAKCKGIYSALQKMGAKGNSEMIKEFFRNVKMSQSVKNNIQLQGMNFLNNLFLKRKIVGFNSIRNFVVLKQRMKQQISEAVTTLQRLILEKNRNEKMKTIYQLRTKAVLSSKRSFLGKHWVVMLHSLFKRKKAKVFRDMQMILYTMNEKKFNQRKGAVRRIISSLKQSNTLLKTLTLQRLREVILYKKNIFKDGKRLNVYNKLYRETGPTEDESQTRLAFLLRKLWLSKLSKGFQGISAFSRFDLYRKMRGFKLEDQHKRSKIACGNLSKVLANLFFKRNLKHGNWLMVRLKDSSFLMKRVYRDKTDNDHDLVVKNTIKIANLVKHFRNKQLMVICEYFERWKEETWEYEDDFGYDDFEEEYMNKNHQQGLHRSHMEFMGNRQQRPQPSDEYSKGHQREKTTPGRLIEKNSMTSPNPFQNQYMK